jgi:hypothetical protein
MASNKKPNIRPGTAPQKKPRAALKYSALIQSGKAGGIPIDTAEMATTDSSEFAASGQSVPLYDMTGAAVFMLPPQLQSLIGDLEYQKLLNHLRQQFEVLILRIGGKVIYVDMPILPMEFDVNAPPSSAVSAMPISPVRAKTRSSKK